MFDIHSHILPMIDDGASSVEMALYMLDQAYRDGTDAIVLTPHYANVYGFNNPKDKITDLFEDLKYIIEEEHIPIKIYLGSEFLYISKESFIKHIDEITTINNTQYLLVEFYFDIDKDDILNAIDTIIAYHFIPIIAHPERYECFYYESSLASEVIKKGAMLQMNKGSILGKYGSRAKETAEELLDHQYISFIGSDAHHPRNRSSLMNEAYEYMNHYYNKDYVEDLFVNNPKKMLKNIDIRKDMGNGQNK